MIIVAESPLGFYCENCNRDITSIGYVVDELNRNIYTMEEIVQKWMDHQLSDECSL